MDRSSLKQHLVDDPVTYDSILQYNPSKTILLGPGVGIEFKRLLNWTRSYAGPF